MLLLSLIVPGLLVMTSPAATAGPTVGSCASVQNKYMHWGQTFDSIEWDQWRVGTASQVCWQVADAQGRLTSWRIRTTKNDGTSAITNITAYKAFDVTGGGVTKVEVWADPDRNGVFQNYGIWNPQAH